MVKTKWKQGIRILLDDICQGIEDISVGSNSYKCKYQFFIFLHWFSFVHNHKLLFLFSVVWLKYRLQDQDLHEEHSELA